MRRRAAATLLVLAAVGVGVALTAAPRSAQATGTTHVWAPSADVQRYRTLHITSDLYVPVERSVSGVRLPSVTNIGLTCGVLPWRRLNLEVGLDHKTGYGVLDSYPMYFNAKLGVPEGAFARLMPAVALGIFDLGTRRGVTDADVVYAKLARTFGRAGRGSVGWFRGNKDLLLDVHGARDNTGIMAAWERMMPEISDRLWLCVDYMGTRSAYGTFSFGGSWRFAKDMTVLVGYDVYNDSRISPSTITIQADVDFGM